MTWISLKLFCEGLGRPGPRRGARWVEEDAYIADFCIMYSDSKALIMLHVASARVGRSSLRKPVVLVQCRSMRSMYVHVFANTIDTVLHWQST